jgi:hypothetical protein
MSRKSIDIETMIANTLIWDNLYDAVNDCRNEAIHSVPNATNEDLKLAMNNIVNGIIDEL